MFTKNLFDVNFRGSASQDPDIRLLAVGPLNKQPGTMLYRIVLIERDDSFVVYREQFNNGVDEVDDICNSSHFSNGHYFNLIADTEQCRVDAFFNAMKCYVEVLERQMKFLPSIIWD